MPTARTILESIYLDWKNNYISVTTFAEHNGITEEQALTLIKLARDVFEMDHPEA